MATKTMSYYQALALGRFAALCRVSRPEWDVAYEVGDPKHRTVQVTHAGATECYDIDDPARCDALVQWLLERFPTIRHRTAPMGRRSRRTIVYAGAHACTTDKDTPLHHASLDATIAAVNAILEQESQT